MKINIEMSKKEKRVAKQLLAIAVFSYVAAVFIPTINHLFRKPGGILPDLVGHEYVQSRQVQEKCLLDRNPERLDLGRYTLRKSRGHDYLANNYAPWFFQTLEREEHYNINYIEDKPECVGHLLNAKSLRNTRKTKKFIYNFYDISSKKLVYQIIKYPES